MRPHVARVQVAVGAQARRDGIDDPFLLRRRQIGQQRQAAGAHAQGWRLPIGKAGVWIG